MNDTLKILIAARKLIERPENWCQGASYRGNSKCAVGAISEASMIVTLTDKGYQAANALSCMLDAYGFSGTIPDFNDTHTHADVLALFDNAIAAERATLLNPQVQTIVDDALSAAINRAPELVS